MPTKAGVVVESSTDIAHESMQIILLGSDPLRSVETVKIAWRWEAMEPWAGSVSAARHTKKRGSTAKHVRA
jgi:hypothetical protein